MWISVIKKTLLWNEDNSTNTYSYPRIYASRSQNFLSAPTVDGFLFFGPPQNHQPTDFVGCVLSDVGPLRKERKERPQQQQANNNNNIKI